MDYSLPLVVAFQRGCYDIARLLIKNGADLDAYCQKNHTTPGDLMPKDFVLGEVKTADCACFQKEFQNKGLKTDKVY